ncbi:MAG: Ig-like domain-containing protein [Ardenticatenaceae bacterium]|nr:Ig-like domain-containing protein [Ardenticatenaceae bacterium]
MWRPTLRWLLPLFLALTSVLPAGSVFAAPDRQGGGRRFTGRVWVTTNPDDFDNLDETTFTLGVEAIYAGIALWWESPEGVDAEVPVEIEFVAPTGRPWRDTEWYDDDQLTITDDVTEDSLARKGLVLAQADPAKVEGEWAVRFTVEGKQVTVYSFNLVSGDNPATVGEFDVEGAVSDAGYEFLSAGTDDGQDKNGDTFTIAWLAMSAISRDLQDKRLIQQVYDGLGILNKGFPDVDIYQVALDYNQQIALVYFAMRDGWERYSAGQIKESDFWKRYASFAIYDKNQKRFLSEEEQKDFQNKSFKGSGTGNEGTGTGGNAPVSPIDLGKSGGKRSNPSVGSVRLEASALAVDADPTESVTLTATVIGSNNRPLANTEVTFAVSGSAGGRVRPTSTTTDATGVAEVIYTPGRDEGSANITASAGGKQATVTIQVGGGGSDNPEDAAVAFLENQGYTVHGVEFFDDNEALPVVVMDAVTPDLNEEHLTQVIWGWLALDNNYKQAEYLTTALLYDRFIIFWSTDTAGFEAWAIDESLDADTFFNEHVENRVFDTTTNEEVRSDDFWNKRFAP